VDLRKGLQGDSVRAAVDLRAVKEDEPMTEDELEAVVSRLSGALGFLRQQAGRPPQSLRAMLRAGVKDAGKVRAARARLVEAGCAKDLVGKFPPAQVLLLDQKREYEVQRDERVKLLGLAPWQITPAAGKESARGLLADLLPDVLTARLAQARLEQRIALLRHVEALRLYAAAHQGKLPARLADCPVPLPRDPFTGKPFRYEAKGDTAQLGSGPASRRHYQVTIQK
jgi:hypothetical protein